MAAFGGKKRSRATPLMCACAHEPIVSPRRVVLVGRRARFNSQAINQAISQASKQSSNQETLFVALMFEVPGKAASSAARLPVSAAAKKADDI
eukprot:m.136174 g.136174  ORF g.136174 m.136174 type:complete len:93 (+) comp52468_c0_seq2:517-795(+)